MCGKPSLYARQSLTCGHFHFSGYDRCLKSIYIAVSCAQRCARFYLTQETTWLVALEWKVSSNDSMSTLSDMTYVAREVLSCKCKSNFVISQNPLQQMTFTMRSTDIEQLIHDIGATVDIQELCGALSCTLIPFYNALDFSRTLRVERCMDNVALIILIMLTILS